MLPSMIFFSSKISYTLSIIIHLNNIKCYCPTSSSRSVSWVDKRYRTQLAIKFLLVRRSFVLLLSTQMPYKEAPVNELRWGLLSQFSPFRYFPNFSECWKQLLPEWYQVHIWQVSPQLSCGDTWQIWTSLKVSNIYFCKIKIFRNGEINERSFSNPHPWTVRDSAKVL